MSPDSRFVLVAAMRSSAVSVLSQGPEGLTQAEGAAGCIANGGGTEGCAAGRGLAGPVDVVVTRDGRNVYGLLDRGRDRDPAARQDDGRAQPGGGPRRLHQPGRGGGRCIRGRALDEV